LFQHAPTSCSSIRCYPVCTPLRGQPSLSKGTPRHAALTSSGRCPSHLTAFTAHPPLSSPRSIPIPFPPHLARSLPRTHPASLSPHSAPTPPHSVSILPALHPHLTDSPAPRLLRGAGRDRGDFVRARPLSTLIVPTRGRSRPVVAACSCQRALRRRGLVPVRAGSVPRALPHLRRLLWDRGPCSQWMLVLPQAEMLPALARRHPSP